MIGMRFGAFIRHVSILFHSFVPFGYTGVMLSHHQMYLDVRNGLPKVTAADIPYKVPPRPKGLAQKPSSPLDDDVRLLGALLGRVIFEHKGEAFFRFIEKLRFTAKRSREETGGINRDAFEVIVTETLSPLPDEERIRRLHDAAVAFRLFLTLTGIAEGYHQSRQFIEDKKGIYHTVQKLKAQGVACRDIRKSVDQMSVRLVATAHPTKILRHIILRHQRDIFTLLGRLHQEGDSEVRQREVLDELAEKVETLWATRFSRWEAPTVTLEARHVLSYFRHTLYDTVLRLHDRLERSIWDHCGLDDIPGEKPLVTFGSWVGGDMDGNPNVNADAFGEILSLQYKTILTLYADELYEIAPRISHAVNRFDVSRQLMKTLEKDMAQMAEADLPVAELKTAAQREPIRTKLLVMTERLRHSLKFPPLARLNPQPDFIYQSPDELLADLALITESLENSGYHRTVKLWIDRFTRKVRLFGFHLASIDLREDAENIRYAGEVILRAGGSDSRKADEGVLQQLLSDEILSAKVVNPHKLDFSGPNALRLFGASKCRATERLLNMLAMAGQAHQFLGPDSCRNLVISMTAEVSDLLIAQLLLKTRGLFYQDLQGGTHSHIDIVPLFETIDALERAADIMDAAFSNPAYRMQTECRGNRQLILLGYSDSNKDGGYFTSNRLLYQAQEKLLAVGEKHGVAIRFFHGRGGNIGRGGAPTQRAIQALPPGSAENGQDLTEQGEVLSRQYNIADIAQAHLENLYAALLVKNTRPAAKTKKTWETAADRISASAMGKYRQLVEHPDFINYFESVTPQEVELVKIGSRPSKRRGAKSIRDLRAIPWVFRWFQSRQNVPGWYGLGTGLKGFIDASPDKHPELLHEMFAEWPFFTSTIANSEITLCQTDLGIARHYLELAENRQSASAILEDIEAEYRLTVKTVQGITGCDLLSMPDDRPLARSIELKTPYLDPLNFIQLYLLEDYRALEGAPATAELYQQAIVSSIEGIAIGLGTTG